MSKSNLTSQSCSSWTEVCKHSTQEASKEQTIWGHPLCMHGGYPDSCLGWTCLIICECLLYVILVICSDEHPPHYMHSHYSNPTDADAIGTYRFPMHIIVSLQWEQ